MKKIIALLLAAVMVLGVVACTGNTTTTQPATSTTTTTTTTDTTKPADTTATVTEPVNNEPTEVKEPDTYTYHTYSSSLGNNWNPHTWETSADDSMLGYISSPFVTMQAENTEDGIYQWVYEMATEINDVTETHQADLTKYAVNLPKKVVEEEVVNEDGEAQVVAKEVEMDVSEVTKGYVFEIKLNPDAKWQDGTPINADSYVYSMQQLLNPEMQNYRANLYYAGESAIAGGNAYYYSKTEGYYVPVTGYASLQDALDAGEEVFINMWDFWGLKGCVDAEGNECPQWVSVADETKYRDAAVAEGEDGDWISAADIFAAYGPYLEVGADYAQYANLYQKNENMGASFDVVGLYKSDDYTLYYVMENQIDYYYALTSFTSTWLVYEPLYEAGKDTSGTLVTTDYGTSVETSMSYGPYKLESLQDDKQAVYVQNENWYGYEKAEDGTLVAYTNYLVDGETKQRYQTTKIIIDVMTDDAAKQAFLKGELDDWAPSAEELPTYAASEQLYKADESYTESFFFCTGLDLLKEMDNSKGNQNSVVMSNVNFRKAFSFGIDRAEWVTATAGYKPTFGLLNDQYYYDFYNDPESSYRSSEQAMQAICDLYGVQYGEGTPYATLRDAYKSINGYNLTMAKELMAQACKELVEAGLYTEGEDIKIRIGYKKGALDSTDLKQVELMNKYINAAAEGSGFGKITLEAVGNINDRYGDTAKGEFAIGYGAWGGAQLYPFRNLQVYCDTDQYSIHEAGCWDPKTEELTLTINGEEVTMTWQKWSQCMVGTGAYANADFDTKLTILSSMEKLYLEKYYRIPLATSTTCSLLSFKCSYVTPDYNLAYGWGGLELMTFNYTDAEWAEFIASQNGALNYE